MMLDMMSYREEMVKIMKCVSTWVSHCLSASQNEALNRKIAKADREMAAAREKLEQAMAEFRRNSATARRWVYSCLSCFRWASSCDRTMRKLVVRGWVVSMKRDKQESSLVMQLRDKAKSASVRQLSR